MPLSNLAERALWTAAQSLIAVLAAAGTDWVDVATWKAAGIAAGAAALSAAKTWLQERKA